MQEYGDINKVYELAGERMWSVFIGGLGSLLVSLLVASLRVA
jgi:hypothetical protein